MNRIPSNHEPKQPVDPSPVYQLRIRGSLTWRWEDWFNGLTISLADNGDTLLTGPVIDQAALYGLLKKIRDLGVPLISVNCIEPGQPFTGGGR